MSQNVIENSSKGEEKKISKRCFKIEAVGYSVTSKTTNKTIVLFRSFPLSHGGRKKHKKKTTNNKSTTKQNLPQTLRR